MGIKMNTTWWHMYACCYIHNQHYHFYNHIQYLFAEFIYLFTFIIAENFQILKNLSLKSKSGKTKFEWNGKDTTILSQLFMGVLNKDGDDFA